MAANPRSGFLDTDVLVYLALADAAKAERTEQFLADGAVISVQVLNELANGPRLLRVAAAPLKATQRPASSKSNTSA